MLKDWSCIHTLWLTAFLLLIIPGPAEWVINAFQRLWLKRRDSSIIR